MQIYCDFSGYTDMAIGLALLLGFRFPQNFNRPYVADLAAGLLAALAHDALALAARLPLHPARRQPERARAGPTQPDDHDAARRAVARRGWTFVVWGGIHGAGLAVERWWRERSETDTAGGYGGRPPPGSPDPGDRVLVGATLGAPERSPPMPVASGVLAAASQARPRGLRHRPGDVLPVEIPDAGTRAGRAVRCLVTFHVVCLAWVFFRSHSVESALTLLSGSASRSVAPGHPAGAGGDRGRPGDAGDPDSVLDRSPAWLQRAARRGPRCRLGAFLVLVTSLVADQGVAPFLYFRF